MSLQLKIGRIVDMQTRAQVVFLTGVDGSGKTTHARYLIEEMKKHGIKARRVWMRGRGLVFVSLPLLALCRLVGLTKVQELPSGHKVSEYHFFDNNAISRLWPWVQLIESIIATVYLVFIPSLFVKFIVVDRGVLDTLVDLCVDIRNDALIDTTGRLFVRLLPKNSLVIILDVSEKISMSRKKEIPNLIYLLSRRRIYHRLSRIYGWKVINTNKDFQKVHREILRIMESTSTPHVPVTATFEVP